MKKLSVSLRSDHVERLDERQENDEVDSRSAAVRELFDEYEDLQTECEQLRTECEELRTECEELRTRLESREQRIDQLEEQLARRSQIQEEIESLPDKIRDSETYSERRQRLLDEASLGQRLVWKVTGVPTEQVEAE